MRTKMTMPPRPEADSVNSFDDIRSTERYSKFDESIPCAHNFNAQGIFSIDSPMFSKYSSNEINFQFCTLQQRVA